MTEAFVSSTVAVQQFAVPEPLVSGQRLTLNEFMSRWDAQPDLKNAELIEGIVHVPSPVSVDHANPDRSAIVWLGTYSYFTPGSHCLNNNTWIMDGSSTQPDVCLRILPEYGGRSIVSNNYLVGAPELIVEISGASAALDLGPKLKLYERMGVQEYITFELAKRQITWRILEKGTYTIQKHGTDGIFRSAVFPGLWLDNTAFCADDGQKVLSTLQVGLNSVDHQQFITELAGRAQSSKDSPR